LRYSFLPAGCPPSQAKIEANHEEWIAAMKAGQERMEAQMDVSLEMMEACLEKIEVNQGKVKT
jgi:hypothetical protein